MSATSKPTLEIIHYLPYSLYVCFLVFSHHIIAIKLVHWEFTKKV